MTKPRVGVDVDGVLADLLTPCFQVASEMLKKPITIDHLTSWDFDTIIPKELLDEFWKRIGEPGICRNLVPYPDAQSGIKALQEVAEVYIVTSYLHDAPQWVHERDQWIMEHFGIPRRKMVHTKAKYTFAASVLVDDKPANIEEWLAENPKGVGVIWDMPFNRNWDKPKGCVRTHSWDEVVRIVKELR